jgi:hypothetical protein
MTITTIAFDGMHRCGKGTQIGLLQEYLKKQYQDSLLLTMRGEYYRHGSGGNTLTDPYSSWRQAHTYTDNYDEKSLRLNRELRYTLGKAIPLHMRKHKIDNAHIILDRSIV